LKAILDVNQFVERLDGAGKLDRISRTVSPIHELASIAVAHERADGGAVLFEAVKGSDIPLVANLYSERDRVSLAFGASGTDLHELFLSAMNNGVKPKMIAKGPVMERTVDSLDALPIPVHSLRDAGRYLTCLMTTKAQGTRVMQHVRAEVKGPRKLGVRIDPGRKFWDVSKGLEKVEVCLVIGAPPAVEFAAALRGRAQDKLEIAGALQRAPVELVQCEEVDCQAPARSEIILEGVVDLKHVEMEGPFAEFTGYYSPPEPMPVVKVSRISMRRNAVHRTIVGASKEHLTLNNVAREAIIYESVRKAVPGVVDVYLPAFAGGFIAFISVKYDYVAMAKNALLSALSAHPVVKCAVVVDEEVDIHDEREVLWAIATRSGGDEDVLLVPHAYGHVMDPAGEKGYVNKLGIDATFTAEKKKLYRKVEYAKVRGEA